MIYNPIDVYYSMLEGKYPFMDIHSVQNEFRTKIINKESFFAGRLGMNEVSFMRAVYFGYKKKIPKCMELLNICAGFFPQNEELGPRFLEKNIDALTKVDYYLPLKVRGNKFFSSKFCRSDVKYVPGVSSFVLDDPWTSALQGKTVLVIHPFEDTIRQQYEKREYLFPDNPNKLPEFNLKTIRAVQTAATERDERFLDWFEALDWMCDQISKVSFDVALIGCGAYGFPLGAFCREQGKIAIHMGGELQLQFGILGNRWENSEAVKKLRNEYWVYPKENEKPKKAYMIEGGCYW